MDYVLSSLLGAVAGIILAVVFEELLVATKKRVLRNFKLWFSRPKPLLPPRTFSIGTYDTSWVVIDGDGEMTYTPDTITCKVDNGQTEYPAEIKQLRESIELQERGNKEKGLSYRWNGPEYGLYRYAIVRTIPYEYMQVTFVFRHTDYYMFQATQLSLDLNLAEPPATLTLRQKYLRGDVVSQPVPFLASSFGVVLAVITKDRKLILSRRSESTGPRPGELDVSIVEGIHPTLDRSSTHHGPDLYRAAIRGAEEEVGVKLVQDQITFLGFGVDMDYYQWNIIGVARITETATDALRNRERGTGGKWETKEFEIVDFEPRAVLTHLKERKIWSTGLITAYWALVHEYGKKQVEAPAKAIFGG